MPIFSKIRDRLIGAKVPVEDYEDEYEDEYVEIDTTKDIGNKAKIVVKSFVINDFSDVKEALDALREGYTIALINIKPLKDKDIVELKRAVNKLKKTCDVNRCNASERSLSRLTYHKVRFPFFDPIILQNLFHTEKNR